MNVTHRVFIIVIIMAFFFGLSACQQDGTAEKAGKKIDQATEKASKNIDQATEKASKEIEKSGEAIISKVEKTEEFMDDAAITAKIKAEILSDPLLKVFQIDVITTNSVVKLSGVVDSKQSIDRAMEIVHSIKNVKSVENNLVVK
jgi:hyperosmotically inducible periplasmic protein